MKIEVDQILHMVGGLGDTSYASNSSLQGKAINRAKQTVQKSIFQMYHTLEAETLVVADLGCSSGPTTFMVISEIMDAVDNICCRSSHHGQPPEVMFLLNDLPGNDFNTIFKSLARYDKQDREEGKNKSRAPYYIVGAPGSFYQRLFPKESVHFIHSSYSLHFLSQVPSGLEDDSGAPVNRGNIYINETSPPIVFESYLEQFQRDFSMFLKLRSKELVSGGQMVLTFLGRSNLQPDEGEMNYLWGLLADAMNSLATEGVLEKEKVDAFNLPFYAPAMEEVKAIVQSEGSFELHQIQTFELNWDPSDDNIDDSVADSYTSGRMTARIIRAVAEPMLTSYFGNGAVTDGLFSKYAMNVAEHLKKKKTKYVNFTIALKKIG